MNKGLPWIILGVVAVAGIIAYIVISNRQSASSSDQQHYTGDSHGSDSNTTGTPSQWIVDLGGLAHILDDLTNNGVIKWR